MYPERTGESLYGRGRGRGRGRFHSRRGGYNGRGERSIEKDRNNDDTDDKSSDLKDEEHSLKEGDENSLGKFRRNSFLGVKKGPRPGFGPQNLSTNGSFSGKDEKDKEKESEKEKDKDKDKDREKEKDKDRDGINWVECTKCSKWRKVPGSIKGTKFQT